MSQPTRAGRRMLAGPRAPRRRDDRQRRHDGPVRRRGRQRHAGDLHAGRGGRGPRPRAGAPGRRARRRARRAPRYRAGQRDEGARRHRPPLPRRRRPLPRLRDDGAADERPPEAFWRADLLEASDRLFDGHPRGAPAGAGHLRPTAATATPTTSRRTGSRRTAPQLAAAPAFRPDLGRPGTSPRSTGAPSPGRCWRGVWRSWPRPGRRRCSAWRTSTTCRSPSTTRW